MHQIREFMDQTEAQMARDYLQANGIPSELHGGKEYASHVLGGNVGRYFLSVPEEHLPAATSLLQRTAEKVPEQIERPTEIPEIALKKSVVFAIIAMVILPVIGNWISFREAVKYSRLEKNKFKKWTWLFVISWLQVPGIYVAWTLVKAIFSVVPVLEVNF